MNDNPLNLFLDPDWICPYCQWVNMAVRHFCRNCGHDGGEFGFHKDDEAVREPAEVESE